MALCHAVENGGPWGHSRHLSFRELGPAQEAGALSPAPGVAGALRLEVWPLLRLPHSPDPGRAPSLPSLSWSWDVERAEPVGRSAGGVDVSTEAPHVLCTEL